jgi:hypothetical protein
MTHDDVTRFDGTQNVWEEVMKLLLKEKFPALMVFILDFFIDNLGKLCDATKVLQEHPTYFPSLVFDSRNNS